MFSDRRKNNAEVHKDSSRRNPWHIIPGSKANKADKKKNVINSMRTRAQIRLENIYSL